MEQIKTNKSRTDQLEEARWSVMIPNYPLDSQHAIKELAKAKRMSVGAYLASLMDAEINRSRAM